MDKDEKIFKRSRRNAYSAQHVKGWEESGLTKTEYGRRNGIHPNVLSRWIKRHAEEKDSGPFVRIDPQELSSDFKIRVELILPNGIIIRLGADMNTADVGDIVNAIRGL